MADTVLVYKFDELDQCSLEMGQVIGALSELKNALKTATDNSESFWKGKAHNAFTQRCKDMNQAVDKLYNNIDSNKKKLDKAIELAKENESDINTRIVGNLPAGDIF